MIHSERIVVLYDSITNSVFISQVLLPLIQWLSADKKRTATIISFEAIDTTDHSARAYIAREKRITLVIYKRLPFFGLPTLWYAAYCISNIVKHKKDARVIARGPFAGYACLLARIQNALIIQIRGLLWHEYEYIYKHRHQQNNQTTNPYTTALRKSESVGKLKVAWTTINFTRWLCQIHYKPCPLIGQKFPFSKKPLAHNANRSNALRCKRIKKFLTHMRHARAALHYRLKLFLYKQLETTLYAQQNISTLTFEAVSPALRDHLITTYSTLKPETITLAYDDIPQPIEHKKRKLWRRQTRAELGIAADALVYCYNGSSKPWQCPVDFFTFCRGEIATNMNAHLLVLSQDSEQFKKLLTTTDIPTERYHLVCVEHDAIYRYMAAADIGLVFRQATLLNWVSRPTKLLEYQAVGLQIIHNATIAWLAESARNQQRYNAPCVQSPHLASELVNGQDKQ